MWVHFLCDVNTSVQNNKGGFDWNNLYTLLEFLVFQVD